MLAKIGHRIRALKLEMLKGHYRAMIRAKWEKDSQCLPLNEPMWELYNSVHWYCLRETGALPNLSECRDLNDRINWLKLFDQDEKMIACSDKLRVRDYVRERLDERYLPKLYQVCESFEAIDLSRLPSSFVIKTNHDSGSVLLVRDKSALDLPMAAAFFEKALQKTYGWLQGEWAYSFIERKILVEEFIDPEGRSPPPDYKFHCSEGKVRFCAFVYGREEGGKEQVLDADGRDLFIGLSPNTYKYGSDFVKPEAWDEMTLVAKKLSQEFKFVRIDLYLWREKIYVGEMTFWPMAGSFSGEGQKKLGAYLDFDRSTYKPFVLNDLLARRRVHKPLRENIIVEEHIVLSERV